MKSLLTMVEWHCAWITIFATLTLATNAKPIIGGAGSLELEDGPRQRQHGGISCRLSTRDVYSDSSKGQGSTVCIPISDAGVESDEIYDIILPKHFMREFDVEIFGGTLSVKLSSATLEERRLVIPDNAIIDLLTPSHQLRKLSVSTGVRTVMVVRGSTSDAQMSLSDKDLREYIFSNSSVTFPTQMELCSFGKLRFIPFQGANGGVVDVFVNQSIANFSNYDELANATVNALKVKFGVSQITEIGVDHVMICLPSGRWVWTGEAVINHWRTVFNDKLCASLSFGMKQIGGNLGLRNSGNSKSSEADYTCYMGQTVPAIGHPQKCFNGDKNSILGWYDDRSKKYNPLTDGPVLIRLAAFVDYNITGPNDVVVAQVGDDMHLQYNRAKSFNAEVAMLKDQVTIVRHRYYKSILLGGVGPMSSYFTLSNFAASGKTLTITACQSITGNDTTPDVMIVSISVDSTTACSSTAVPQTSPPTPAPAPSGGVSVTLPTVSTPGLFSSFGPISSTFAPQSTLTSTAPQSIPSTPTSSPSGGTFFTLPTQPIPGLLSSFGPVNTFAPQPSSTSSKVPATTALPTDLRRQPTSDTPSITPSINPSLTGPTPPAVASSSNVPSHVPSIRPSQLALANGLTVHPTFTPTITKYPSKSPSPSITFPLNYTAAPGITFHPTFSPTATKGPTMSPTSSALPTAQGPPSNQGPTMGPTSTAIPTRHVSSFPPATNRSNITQTASTPPSPTLIVASDAPSSMPSSLPTTLRPQSVVSDSPSFSPSVPPVAGVTPAPTASTSVSEMPSTSPSMPATAGTTSVVPSTAMPSLKPTRRHHRRHKGHTKKSHNKNKGFFSGNPFDPTVKNFKANSKRDHALAKVFLQKKGGGKGGKN